MTEVTQANAVEGFRLSPQQRDLWRQQMAAGAAAFAASAAVEIEGAIDAERLARALEVVVGRYEILRTGFHSVAGASLPVQVIGEAGGVSVAAEPVTAPWADAAALRKPPLLHIALQPAGDRSRLTLTVPALCADAIGLHNTVAALAAVYSGAEDGDEPLQYADLAEWQNELLEDADARAFSLRVADARATLPGVRAGAATAAQDVLRQALPAELGQALAAVAERRRTTVEVVCLAGFAALVHRLTGREQVLLGARADGRAYEGLDRAIGLFARDVPVSVFVDGERPFAAVVDDAAAAWSSAGERVEQFSWERVEDATEAPYFALAFAAEDRSQVFAVGDARWTVVGTRAHTQHADVRVLVVRDVDGWAMELHGDAARVDRAAAARWLDQLIALLAHAADEVDTPVGALRLLDANAAADMLRRFNAATAPVDTDRTIHATIEAAVDRDPNAVAVQAVDGALTYGELERRANQVAHLLRDLGVGVDDRVGLCLERSASMLVGLLGILKAGAGYVPLDPGYPRDRLAFLLADSGARAVVTDAAGAMALPPHEVATLCLDGDAERLAAASADRPQPVAAADHLAYVIYTSGSTGTPKGVEITHRTLLHSTLAREAVYPEAPGRYLLVSSYAFDSSVAGLFWTAVSGGALVLPGQGLERDLRALRQLIDTHAVTHTLMLPSLYTTLLRETGGEGMRSLRCVIVAGEACSRDTVDLHHELLPDAGLWNEYGPTEGTVWATVHHCVAADEAARVPIGVPIRNVQAYVLDAAGGPLPVGVPGELYIGGDGLARGYLGRPELTAERFVRNHLAETPGDRLYRTGDLVCRRDDGALDFLGRVDHQVKVRGYRIELEEVEAALVELDGIAEAAVAAPTADDGAARLVGYVVPAAGSTPSTAAIADALRAALPDYMVPAQWVVLDALPLNPNGKVDRAALPEPADGAVDRPTYAAPQGAVETVLAELWADVLQVESVGREDNFFQLGGHSLLVTQLVFRVRDTLGVEMPLRLAFEAPTLAALGEALLADPDRRARAEKAAALIEQLSAMSEDEVDAMLESEDRPD